MLTKTPSVKGLAHFMSWFPESHAVVLVRDGRDVVESAVRTFGWSYERAMAVWVEGAEAVRTFETDPRLRGARYVRVRYEDLLSDPALTVRGLLEAVDADPEVYDFAALEQLPVRGSSVETGGRPTVHWDPVPRPPDFARGRWGHWDRRRRLRFDWLAGDLLDHFGYPRSGDRPSARDSARNRLTDLAVGVRGRGTRLVRGLRADR